MSQAPKRHRIDTHHHIFPPSYVSAERERIVAIAPTYAREILEWTPEKSIEAMDAGDIATAVTSISTPGVWFGDVEASRRLVRDCNEYAAQIARDRKGRFGVFATLALPDVDGSLREIEYAFDVLKVDGIGILTNYGDKWPGEHQFAPVFDELNRRKAVIYFHPTVAQCCTGLMPGIPPAAVEFAFDTTRAIVSLLYNGIFSRCTNLRFIFSHAGGTLPMVAHRLSNQAKRRKDYNEKFPNGVMHEFRKLYYDVVSAAHPIPFEAIRQIAGTSHLLYGSDFPYWHPDVTTAGLRELQLSAEELRAVERDNALALLPRLATG